MKKLLVLLLAINSYSQAPTIEWQKSLGGSAMDLGNDIKPTNDGGYIALGSTFSNDFFIGQNYRGSFDIYVVKTDANGNIQWQKTFGGSGYDVGISIEQTADNGYLISGYTDSTDGDITTNHGLFDVMVMKLNADGNLQWLQTYGGSSIENSFHIIELGEGGYIFSGHTSSTDGQINSNHGQADAWIVKLNSSGEILWQKTLGGSQLEFINKILPTNDNNLIIVGHTNSSDGDVSINHGSIDGWIVKLSPDGNLIWEKTFGSSGDDYLYDIKTTSDGGYIASGQSDSVEGDFAGQHGLFDAWTVKLTGDGILQWQKIYGGSLDESLSIAHETVDGNFIFAGETASEDGDLVSGLGEQDVWIVKTNNSGEILWQQRYGGTASESINAFVPTVDNGFVSISPSTSNDGDLTNNAGGFDFWLVKLTAENLGNNAFEKNKLEIYPIPVAHNLYFKTPNPVQSLSITDIYGKTVVHQTVTENAVSVENLAAGLYLIKVVTGGETYQTKFIKE
ncbi:T9SS type A sorting domain-containing protein [Flavobacterium sp. CYK-4]|uniref:T9SS type A sorting domain-containing protein n=1 Tax=Flavobacterium lotistagni TaxID=2709660 RepID=UPI00140A8C90|nr:T9SS type A sorting domain-containing protein [Flavobacterium lotistagni]NHM06844.1 T9SS type A sorting domain-containing protein [Flavobacterium lotistagni]